MSPGEPMPTGPVWLSLLGIAAVLAVPALALVLLAAVRHIRDRWFA